MYIILLKNSVWYTNNTPDIGPIIKNETPVISTALMLLKYIFISTHSEELHKKCIEIITKFNYRIEISSGHETQTTSCDGLIFASNKILKPIFNNFHPLVRLDILNSSPARLKKFINEVQIPSF